MPNSTKSKYEKKGNVIHKITSETLRLTADDITRSVPPTANSLLSSHRKIKIPITSSSFQITGVTVMAKNDYGDDSADDLDESHTDDISRITDNETPSFSEDSRDTDEHGGFEGVNAVAAPQSQSSFPPVQPASENKLQHEHHHHHHHQVLMPSTNERISLLKFEEIDKESIVTKGRWDSITYSDAEGCVFGHPYNILIAERSKTLQIQDADHGNIQGNNQLSAQPTRRQDQIYVALPGGVKFATLEAIHKGSDLSNNPSSVSKWSASNNNIDRKIEEALDAVKSHLMVAVHKEVEFLKSKVSTLEGRVNELELENSILRVNNLNSVIPTKKKLQSLATSVQY